MHNLKKLISKKYFYESHASELSKFISDDIEFINIFNSDSNVPRELFKNSLFINSDDDFEKYSNENFSINQYDLIILSNIFELSEDIYKTLKIVKKYLKPEGLLILTSVNPIWYKVLNFFGKIGLINTSDFKSYIKPKKIQNILRAANYEKINCYNRLPIPIKIFGLGKFINLLINLLFPFLNLGINNYLIFSNQKINQIKLSKSIIIPAKNEEGNLEELVNRIPKFDTDYELVIVCGKSRDNTLEKAKKIQQDMAHLSINVFEQSKNGKANAVWEGLEECKNEVISILDSDLSVDPERLIDFYEIIENGQADFVNGTRLIYKMEKGAMRYLNRVGNVAFQFLISKLTSTNLTDSLCGTKVFKRKNISIIKNWQNKMRFKDPFCDFDLIFSAAYFSQKIVELPVHYRSRTYGSTNISRFRDGWKLFFYFINSYILFKTSSK